MTRRAGGVVRGVVAALVMLPAVASAQGKPDDKQDCLTASDQGQNQRDDGLYRAARESFVACARDVCPKVVAQSCTRWLRELDEGAPTVVLAAKDEQGNDLTDVTVLFDGQPFASALEGKPVEADAGEHVLHFERNGSAPVEQKLVLRAGEKARVVTVVLRPLDGPSSAEPEAAKTSEPPEGEPAREPLFSAHHVTAGALAAGAIAAAGAGVVLVVVSNQDKASAAGLRAHLSSDACTHASTPTCSALSDKVTSQHHDMNIAAGLLVGAGALAVGGLIAWFVWPRAEPSPPPAAGSIAPVSGGAVVQVTGGF